MAAGAWAPAETRFDGGEEPWLARCEDTWMELGVGVAEGADTGRSFSWRTVRSVLVGRENVFKVEPRSGVEQLRNALKHL